MCFLALALMVINQPLHPSTARSAPAVPSRSDLRDTAVASNAKTEDFADEDADVGSAESLSILLQCTLGWIKCDEPCRLYFYLFIYFYFISKLHAVFSLSFGAAQMYWLARFYAEFALSDFNLRRQRHNSSPSPFKGKHHSSSFALILSCSHLYRS
jgi:hypothetical protein